MRRCDTEAMNLHLAEIATQDRAWGARRAALIPLPPKCLELNPQGNIWQFMRDNWVSNRIFKIFRRHRGGCCHAWNKLTDQPWRIMSIGIRHWAYRS